jgi:hypothetical protein
MVVWITLTQLAHIIYIYQNITMYPIDMYKDCVPNKNKKHHLESFDTYFFMCLSLAPSPPSFLSLMFSWNHHQNPHSVCTHHQKCPPALSVFSFPRHHQTASFHNRLLALLEFQIKGIMQYVCFPLSAFFLAFLIPPFYSMYQYFVLSTPV